MENLPEVISIIFIITTLITIYFFYRAAHRSVTLLTIAVIWLALQGIIGFTGFYQNTSQVPPRFMFLVLPPLIAILLFFVSQRGRRFIDRLDLKSLTLLHVVRIPVEIVLYWLFVYKKVPELMTFEGRNFDILSGITAPFIYYFGFVTKRLPRKVILIWNVICLLLLINIVVNAILSAPFRFQQFAFDQPNIALLYFPFVWLPSIIVPLVLFSHLASIRQLSKKKVW
jgi:hypothetical protein